MRDVAARDLMAWHFRDRRFPILTTMYGRWRSLDPEQN